MYKLIAALTYFITSIGFLVYALLILCHVAGPLDIRSLSVVVLCAFAMCCVPIGERYTKDD
jgi:hypothetical protein